MTERPRNRHPQLNPSGYRATFFGRKRIRATDAEFQAVTRWLADHPRAWHGWPTCVVVSDTIIRACRERLFVHSCPYLALDFGALAAAVADCRHAARKRYRAAVRASESSEDPL